MILKPSYTFFTAKVMNSCMTFPKSLCAADSALALKGSVPRHGADVRTMQTGECMFRDFKSIISAVRELLASHAIGAPCCTALRFVGGGSW